jgi:hypothetical protein
VAGGVDAFLGALFMVAAGHKAHMASGTSAQSVASMTHGPSVHCCAQVSCVVSVGCNLKCGAVEALAET